MERRPKSPEEWKKVDAAVNVAGRVQREAAQVSSLISDISKENKTLKAERKVAFVPRNKTEQLLADEERFLDEEVARLLSPYKEAPELIALRMANLKRAVKTNRVFDREIEELLQEESELLALGRDASMPRVVARELARVEADIKLKKNAREATYQTSPEAFYGLHLQELKDYKQQLENGKIVEVPYVKEQVEDVVSHLHAGKPVFLYGHLGSGKTEIAIHAAKKFSGKDPEIVSGSKNMGLSELYGHQVLDIQKITKEDLVAFTDEVQKKYEDWSEKNKEASELDKQLAHDRILQAYLKHASGGTVSRFFLGPVYKAMKEGRALIIDEVNAIPHEILISLNHILTRKVGDVVSVQQDSGEKITVAEGYGVIMTGNLNQGETIYLERLPIDPAFKSRVYSKEHKYIPQRLDGTEAEVDPNEDQMYTLLIARLMDGHGNMSVPKDAPRQLFNLAKFARLTQDVFSSEHVADSYYRQEAGGSKIAPSLKESVMSVRALEAVINQWQKEGFKRNLEYYLWKEFISQSTVPADQTYLYEMAKTQFAFFQDAQWPEPASTKDGWTKPVGLKKIPETAVKPVEFFDARDVVEMAYGKKAPERTVWPELKPEEELQEIEFTAEQIARVQEMKVYSKEALAQIATLELKVNKVCEREKKVKPATPASK